MFIMLTERKMFIMLTGRKMFIMLTGRKMFIMLTERKTPSYLLVPKKCLKFVVDPIHGEFFSNCSSEYQWK